MDNIDATNREHIVSTAPPPSLLTVILDTSPPSWAHLDDIFPLSAVVKTLLVFINAHLAMNHANKVAVLASYVDQVQWLYPTPLGNSKIASTNGTTKNSSSKPTNKYRPFLSVEEELRSNLQMLLSATPPSNKISSTPLLSAAISTALTYTNMQILLSEPTSTNLPTAQSVGAAGASDLDAHTNAIRHGATGPSLVARTLVVSVSMADLSSQYIALMNAVFAAQRLNIPIDILRLGPRTAFLQQASDATGGIFMTYDPVEQTTVANGNRDNTHESNVNAATAGLLQTLLMAYLPDVTARKHLIPAGSAEVDFRAACFCHGNIVDLGGVCSVCLSIFCIPLPAGLDHCPTCQSALRIPKSLSVRPAVVPRKKKKKKRIGGLDGRDTPGLTSGAATPAQGTPMR